MVGNEKYLSHTRVFFHTVGLAVSPTNGIV